jgi:LacI family transcriptional regulator
MAVAIVLPTDLHYMRQIMLGAQSYFRAAGIKHSVTNAITEATIAQLGSDPAVDGVITAVVSAELERLWIKAGCPVVNTSSRYRVTKLPSVIPDNVAIGRIAAEHFLQRGFRNFAFFGDLSITFAAQRHAGFRATLDEAGMGGSLSLMESNVSPAMGQWLAGLPRPCGILAMSDHHAMRIIETIQSLGIRVPEDIAVMGVDNDDITCAVAPIPLSSVDPDARRVGYLAAQTLEKMLLGQDVATAPVLVPPDHVVVRQSTDALVVTDLEIASVLRYIHEHACGAMRIDNMMDELALSRRTMERRFKACFGYTLHDEIRRVRMERARQLLSKTQLKVPAIAKRCGFQGAKRFSADFKRFVGKTPSEFRHSD